MHEVTKQNSRLTGLRSVAICLLAVGFCVAVSGCDSSESIQEYLPLLEITESPVANLPTELRPYNWTDSGGSGSCVNASQVYNLTWVGMPELAQWWRDNTAGGETDTSIRRQTDAVGLDYYSTNRADMGFLDWCTATRRSALIWHWPRHCVNFVGFGTDPYRPTDPTEYAWLCDNNRPTHYIPVERNKFARDWDGYGGFGLALAAPPVPPPLFDATLRSTK
ncbi:hypothetical protein Poly21_31810 [Allorhodopirellula heiligendammensis]|uniref:Peptidase C39-like domain-containing protein n=1 Tax=Allorhodopirellula heiligendammensis TaxID=2714739 RepID=A0A5C6BWG8_9BACT|nr:hypothetical protein Poly21_31810 [Allorhodopirellula heiligendammensis]